MSNDTTPPVSLPLDIEARVAQAVAYFKQGYNCAQSVVAAYADLSGLPAKLAPAHYPHLTPTTLHPV